MVIPFTPSFNIHPILHCQSKWRKALKRLTQSLITQLEHHHCCKPRYHENTVALYQVCFRSFRLKKKTFMICTHSYLQYAVYTTSNYMQLLIIALSITLLKNLNPSYFFDLKISCFPLFSSFLLLKIARTLNLFKNQQVIF